MSKFNTPKLDSAEEKIRHAAHEGIEHADELYKHAKERASDFYEEGKKRVGEAQDNIKECTDKLIQHVKEKPITSLLIAGGIGFILSSLLKK